ncbi:hypothetical protein Ga0080574_TMP2819 [Salipiger abyssi]|uniref:Uncharacterized protein n=2 Tax=Salipiger abyssi TaxID=1250539 RepID=A0A1P8UUT0_9RHOB|nr:hypothetical protein Ga0080574_TMP2819 [Salipiger abyssi]
MVYAMGFRVVVRDEGGKIVRDEPAEHFAAAKPIYDDIEPESGQTVALQHGIRVVLSKG